MAAKFTASNSTAREQISLNLREQKRLVRDIEAKMAAQAEEHTANRKKR